MTTQDPDDSSHVREADPPELLPEDAEHLQGPPEPIKKDDDTIFVKYLAEEGQDYGANRIRTVRLGTWKCEQCETEMELGMSDGEFIEPYQCTGCDREGPFTHVGLSEQQAQVAKRSNTMWFLPSGISDNDIDGLWNDIRTFIQEHWDSSHPELYEGLTAYAISTWLRENLTFVPHLMLMGKTTGGKTRLLNTMARVSYRAIVSASATPSSMFRLVDGYDVTYYISEYHGLDKDARRELDNVIRGGQKRGELVTRSEQNGHGYEPDVYDPFTHVAVATQYEPDDDIINRCVQVRSSPANRKIPPTLDEEFATEIRNRLLFIRWRLLGSETWQEAERRAYGFLEERNIDGRTREKLLSIVTVAEIWDRVELIVPFVERVVRQDREAASESEDAVFVEALRDLAEEEIGSSAVLGDSFPWGAVEVPYGNLAERYERMTGIEKSNSWVGHVRSRLGLDSERTRNGTAIKDDNLGQKLEKLCDDLNLEFDPAGEKKEKHENLASATSKPPHGELKDTVLAVIRSHAEQQDDRRAPSEDVMEALAKNHDENRINDMIEKLKKEGEIMEPVTGRLEPTENA